MTMLLRRLRRDSPPATSGSPTPMPDLTELLQAEARADRSMLRLIVCAAIATAALAVAASLRLH
jgi:hypothetical protein